jgi:hypothetical protein
MKCRGIEVKIVCSNNQALVAEVEMDEMGYRPCLNRIANI